MFQLITVVHVGWDICEKSLENSFFTSFLVLFYFLPAGTVDVVDRHVCGNRLVTAVVPHFLVATEDVSQGIQLKKLTVTFVDVPPCSSRT